MRIISNVSITFTFLASFLGTFFHKCNIILHHNVILALFLLTVALFSFQSRLHFLKVFSYKFTKRFKTVFPNIKYACSPYGQMPKLLTFNIRKEYVYLFLLLRIFSGLVTHPSIFFSDFTYRLHINILSFSSGY